MKLKFLLLLPIFSITSISFAQTTIDWKFLSDVKFEDKFYPEYDAWYLFPKFSDKIKSLDGKQVKIKGYVIPMDVEDGLYALSANPFSSCFFCGAAGPETVMSLKFAGPPPDFETDDVATFTGILHLNTTDLDTFNYVLKNAKVTK